VWLTPHLRDPQPEGERERAENYSNNETCVIALNLSPGCR